MSNTKFEITKVKPSECGLAIAATFAGRRVPFIWGPPGVAKSAIAQLYATSRGVAFADIRLSQMEPTDLRGIPFPVTENGVSTVRWSPPMVLPSDLNINQITNLEYPEVYNFTFVNSNPLGSNDIYYVKKPEVKLTLLATDARKSKAKVLVTEQTPVKVSYCIVEVNDDGSYVPDTDENGAVIGDAPKLFKGTVRVEISGEAEAVVGLEEFNSAPQTVQAASYQLILDRRVGEYVVPKKVDIMALGNRDTDKGITFKMPTPAANRFEHFEMVHDYEEFEEWAVKANLHWTIVSFLSRFKDYLFVFEPSSASRGFATPRSWHMLSDILSAPENEFLTGHLLTAVVCGAVGDAIGLQYVEFRKVADLIPHPEEILSGRLKSISRVSVPDSMKEDDDFDEKNVAMQIAFAIIGSVCYEMHSRIEKIKLKFGKDYPKTEEFSTWLNECNNFIGFIMENFDPEPNIMAGRLAIRIRRLPFVAKHMSNLDTFVTAYKQFLFSEG